MILNQRSYRFGLILGLISIFLGACGVGADLHQNPIQEVQSPLELSDELRSVRFFLFKRGNLGSKVALVDVGQNYLQIYHNPDYLSRVDVSPDGRQLVYVRMTSVGSIQPIWLYRVDLESGQEFKLAGWFENYDQISLTNPGFTQDGEQVLFSVTWYDTGEVGLARVNSDGSDLEILDTDIPLAQGPETSPDGSLIMVLCAGPDDLNDSVGFQLCLLDHQGHFIQFLTDRGFSHGRAFFSPDGEKVVFTEYDRPRFFELIKPISRFYVMDITTDQRTLLLSWDLGVLGFSESGEEIIFEGRPSESAPWAIYIISIDGGDLRHLAYFDDFLDDWYADTE
jgi:Tol biopolymer transport system component